MNEEKLSMFFSYSGENNETNYEIPGGIWQHYSNLQLSQMALLFQRLSEQKEGL